MRRKQLSKCDRKLLQSASGIAKCDRLLLQSMSSTTKFDLTQFLVFLVYRWQSIFLLFFILSFVRLIFYW